MAFLIGEGEEGSGGRRLLSIPATASRSPWEHHCTTTSTEKQNRLQGVQSTQPVSGEGNQPRTFETTTDESGRKVVVVVHEADVSRGEAHSQQWFLAVH